MTIDGNDNTFTVRISEAEAGGRLDKCLATALPDLSRSRLKSLIEAGRVSVCGEVGTDPAYRVRTGQILRVDVPEPEPDTPAAQPIRLEVVYEDDDLIVVDKPAGMVVHPAPGSPDATLVNALLAHCGQSLSGIGGVRRPGIVHRIDKDTSGLIVAAKNDLAHKGLAAQFSAHSLERAYQAVVWGVPASTSGIVEGNIGRNPNNRKTMAVVSGGGKPARTRYRVVKIFGTLASLIECRLETGRTHQIRVHMTSIGHPLVGDRLYGRPRGNSALRASSSSSTTLAALRAFKRQALHAYLLGFVHPRTQEKWQFQSEIPIDIKELIFLLDKC